VRDCLQHRIAQRVTTPEKFKLPAEAPKTGVSSDLGAWAKLADDAPKRAAAAAVTWRTGLAGFVTLLLSVLVLKGADVGDIGGPYRWIAIVSLACGAALAIVGLWKALSAEAPPETTGDYDRVIGTHHSVAEYLQAVAEGSWAKLRHARLFVGLSLAAILVGIIAWWAAPLPPKQGKVSITWQTSGGQRTDCGSLVAAEARAVGLQANDATDVVTVKTSDIVRMKQVAIC